MKKRFFNLSVILVVSVISILLSGCKQESNTGSTTETLEIYDTINEGEAYSKGTLKHYESKSYKGDKHVETIFYNADGEAQGRQQFLFKEGSNKAYRSEYYSPEGDLMSYYEYEYDDVGNQKKINAYDGQNDELLRIETFDYDGVRRIRRDIRNSNNEIQRSFLFGFDQYNNETSMTVIGAQGDTLAIETYKITLVDDSNQWLEKWGFVNDVPSTYQVKKK